mmetsp:Transcript_55382/g.160809  ORF Transcript_55382/g.160809 Transcript_55382/m.160809 type:complete len:231 (+) Transcript_55382:210-902(+)
MPRRHLASTAATPKAGGRKPRKPRRLPASTAAAPKARGRGPRTPRRRQPASARLSRIRSSRSRTSGCGSAKCSTTLSRQGSCTECSRRWVRSRAQAAASWIPACGSATSSEMLAGQASRVERSKGASSVGGPPTGRARAACRRCAACCATPSAKHAYQARWRPGCARCGRSRDRARPRSRTALRRRPPQSERRRGPPRGTSPRSPAPRSPRPRTSCRRRRPSRSRTRSSP